MTIDYEKVVNKLKESEKDINSVAIIEENKVLYSTDDWDISSDIENVLKVWSSMDSSFITISGVKFSLLQCTDERLICTSVRGQGHIVGAKDTERVVLASVNPNGYMTTAYMSTARALGSMSTKKAPREITMPTREEQSEITDLRQSIMDELSRLLTIYRSDEEMPVTPPPGPTQPRPQPIPISIRSSLIAEVKRVLSEGVKFEKANEDEVQSREEIHKLRVEQLEKVRQALEVSKEIEKIELTFETSFKTPYIYDDLHLLKVKHKIKKMFLQYFNIEGDLMIELTKNL